MNSKTSKTQVFINLESDNIPLQPLCSLYLASDSQRRVNLNKNGRKSFRVVCDQTSRFEDV